MKSVTWVWFSGTGNTWLALQVMVAALRGQDVAVKTRRMETVSEPLELPLQETLGLAFPVACFSTYPLVWRFLTQLPPGEGRGVVLLTTMGGLSGGMTGPVGRFLRAKGYTLRAAANFVMPGNYGNAVIPVEANARCVRRCAAMWPRLRKWCSPDRRDGREGIRCGQRWLLCNAKQKQRGKDERD